MSLEELSIVKLEFGSNDEVPAVVVIPTIRIHEGFVGIQESLHCLWIHAIKWIYVWMQFFRSLAKGALDFFSARGDVNFQDLVVGLQAQLPDNPV
jgi:hypothetical protein